MNKKKFLLVFLIIASLHAIFFITAIHYKGIYTTDSPEYKYCADNIKDYNIASLKIIPYNLFKLIGLVEKKFGVVIEPTILLSKLNELSDNLSIITPLLLVSQKNLDKKVKLFFQNIFNTEAKKKLSRMK